MSTEPNGQRPIRLLIVDDHPLTRNGLKAEAAEQPDMEVVGEDSGSVNLADFVSHLNPDIITLDIRLKGGMNGLSLARRLRFQFEHLKILIISNFDQEPYIREAIRVQVDGYLLKSSKPSDIIQAIRTVVSDGKVFAPEVLRRLYRHQTNESGDRTVGDQAVTGREAEVIQFLADGLSNSEIAVRLSVSKGAVEFHLKNAYSKLGVNTRTGAVAKAARLGIVVIDDLPWLDP